MNTSLLSVLLMFVLPATISTAPEETAQVQTVDVGNIDLSGTWSGTWCSRTNGHKGPMTATFCRISSHQYSVTFKGKFCKLIPFRYQAVLCASPGIDGTIHLRGSKNLGLIFGTFTFRGTASETQFHANYYSAQDQGIFTLSRYR